MSRTSTSRYEVPEPVPLLYEVTYVSGREHIAYDFELEEGDELLITISSDDYVDLSICSERDYERWLKDGELMEYEGAEGVREKKSSFTACKTRTYFLLIINDGDEDVDVTVEVGVLSTRVRG